MNQSVPSPVTVEYPSSDGKPMAENDAQRFAILYMIGALKTFFAYRQDVYVSGDLLIYCEEGNPRRSVAPDVLVVFGVEDRQRPTYKVWEEGKAPDFVLEVASPSTWEDDEGWKAELYERLGVREYWQYDPTGEQLGVRLKGRRLVLDPATSRRLLSHQEDHAARRASDSRAKLAESRAELAESRAEREAAARRAAEARLAELEALAGGKR